MKWAAVELARFARGAGFHRDDVPEAVALALATSGGIDTYDFRTGLAGCGHYMGLWGVDVDRWPWAGDRDLHVPHHAAAVAYELTQHHGGWHWSPVWALGHHVHYVEHAAVEASREMAAQTPAEPVTFNRSHDMIGDALASMRAGIVAAQRLHTKGTL